jgi:hypothetical protein
MFDLQSFANTGCAKTALRVGLWVRKTSEPKTASILTYWRKGCPVNSIEIVRLYRFEKSKPTASATGRAGASSFAD